MASRSATTTGPTGEYVPGACNIGPAEIGRRRRVGWLGVATGVLMLAGLLAVDAEPWMRIAIALPAGLAASGFIQARQHFCANFGYRGIYNFEGLGSEVRVAVEAALRADRRRAYAIALQSAMIGLAVAVATMLIR